VAGVAILSIFLPLLPAAVQYYFGIFSREWIVIATFMAFLLMMWSWMVMLILFWFHPEEGVFTLPIVRRFVQTPRKQMLLLWHCALIIDGSIVALLLQVVFVTKLGSVGKLN